MQRMSHWCVSWLSQKEGVVTLSSTCLCSVYIRPMNDAVDTRGGQQKDKPLMFSASDEVKNAKMSRSRVLYSTESLFKAHSLLDVSFTLPAGGRDTSVLSEHGWTHALLNIFMHIWVVIFWGSLWKSPRERWVIVLQNKTRVFFVSFLLKSYI